MNIVYSFSAVIIHMIDKVKLQPRPLVVQGASWSDCWALLGPISERYSNMLWCHTQANDSCEDRSETVARAAERAEGAREKALRAKGGRAY